MAKKKKHEYLNNQKFYEEMVRYKAMKEPVISNYIGECIHLICTNLIKRPNFSGYSQHWKEEMVSDALENCISTGLKSFDPEKSKHPFNYFTTVAYRAFQRRIIAEKKQTYIKHKNAQDYFLHGKIQDIEANELSDNIILDFEESLQKKKDKAKAAEEAKKNDTED